MGGPMTALRDAGLSALVALGLFAAMIGLRSNISNAGQMELVPEPVAVAVAVAAVFFGRLAMSAWAARRKGAVALPVPAAKALAQVGRLAGPILLGCAVALPFVANRYWIDTGVVVLTYVMLGWGLNIVVGLAGLLDLGYVAFYAVGAYSYSLIAQNFGLGFWTCLPLAGILAAFWGVLLGFPVLRLRGDYLAIVTLAFGEIIRVVLLNWTSLSGGSNGIGNIPRPTFFGLTMPGGGEEGTFAEMFGPIFGFEGNITLRLGFLYFVILGLALLTNWVSLRLRRLPLGRAWEALREDEIACRALGIDVTITKLTAFGIGAGFGGFAGAFFATRQGFINPESFTFTESALVLAIVVLGGLGSQLGVALAALVMIGTREIFRDFQEYSMLVFGVALVVVMVVRPRGLISGRTPSVSLGTHKQISADLVSQGHG
jgi:branched-chain amino acid transport system permease protein